MTRYEFAVAIARLLEKIPAAVDLSNYYTKAETDEAIRAATAGFATKEEVAELRRLVNEFQTELTTLGVDVDALKRRMTALEGRVTALEAEVKRVTVYGTASVNARATNTRTNNLNFRDQDGYVVQRGSVTPTNAAGNPLPGALNPGNGNLLGATRVLHDIDLGIKARITETATADVLLNFGNYLSFLGGVGSYSNFPNGRTGATGGAFANQNQTQTIYRAVIEAPLRLPGIGGVTATIGRVPLQLTPYTLKLIDVDQYFYNEKTDLGNIPIDGGKLAFNLGPVGITGIAGKTDPIKFLSNINQTITDDNSAGLYAGAGFGAYSGIPGTGGLAPPGRPSGNTLQRNGGMLVEQLAGARVVLGGSRLGTIGATYLALAGTEAGRDRGHVYTESSGVRRSTPTMQDRLEREAHLTAQTSTASMCTALISIHESSVLESTVPTHSPTRRVPESPESQPTIRVTSLPPSTRILPARSRTRTKHGKLAEATPSAL
jgi:hypothetical protein